MKRAILIVVGLVFVAACGDNLAAPSPLSYTDPSGGKLRLVKDPVQHGDELVLDLVVGDQALTGYSVGFDLPCAPGKMTLGGLVPGTALPAGDAPAAAIGTLRTSGPLANTLVTGQSQKATGIGAVTADANLAAGAVLYQLKLEPITGAEIGVVFDGTATGFALPSGGLRDRGGTTVVEAKDVAIGKLELTR